MMRFGFMACVALGTILQAEKCCGNDENEHTYCIIGAGPAGLQLGHFFKHAGRDYIIFERSERAGFFFTKYPRHRKLISLNKRSVRRERSSEFGFRHDWNSLIDVRNESTRTPPVTKRSEDLFPDADVLAEYLAEYAEEQHDFIRFGVKVRHIRRGKNDGFIITLASSRGDRQSSSDQALATDYCREIIVATGLWHPRGAKVTVDGADLLQGYEELPEKGHAYEGQSVVILGLGNAAMETAQALQHFASEVHIYGRVRDLPQGGKGVRFAYETHYVGDIRAGRKTILDTYLLKSLDSFDFTKLGGTVRLVVIPCFGGKRCVWSVQDDDCLDEECRQLHTSMGQNLNYRLPITTMLKSGALAKRVENVMRKYAWNEKDRGWLIEHKKLSDDNDEDDELLDREALAERAHKEKQSRLKLGIDDSVFDGEFQELHVSSRLLRAMPELMDALAPLRAQYSQQDTRQPFDHVIRCFGWAMDTSIFDHSVLVTTSHKGKYPRITSNFTAVSAPGLYFAGTLTHSLDFRRSAGGFIHGFRYTARALFRGLEEKNFGVPWPSKIVEMRSDRVGGSAKSPVNVLADMLSKRINEASGPYQMFEFLGDMVVFEAQGVGSWNARYLEEVPLTNFHTRMLDLPRLTWVFKYGDGFYGPQVLSSGPERVGSNSMWTAHKSKFLHPQLQYFAGGETSSSLALWMNEDIPTVWTATEVYSSLANFVSRVLTKVSGIDQWGPYSLEHHEDITSTVDTCNPAAS